MGENDDNVLSAKSSTVENDPNSKMALNAITMNSSSPRQTREETVRTLEAILEGPPSPCDVYGNGPLLVSDVPPNARTEGVVMGIDEAGRGPVLGPMTYGAAYWSKTDATDVPRGFNDSKALSAETRSALFEQIKEAQHIGFVLRVLHASEISRNMLRKEPYNLNAMSHNAAIQIVRAVLDAGVKIDTCFVDTVGLPEHYQAKLDREFDGHDIKFVVEKKADAKYAPCSAASVVAKVSRDTMIESWTWTEESFEAVNGNDFGSGYPSDPKCKVWMEKNMSNPVFCYPDLVRFSWGPAKKITAQDGVKVEWEADDEDDEDEIGAGKRQQMNMNVFVLGATCGAEKRPLKNKRRRLAHFEKLGISSVTRLTNG